MMVRRSPLRYALPIVVAAVAGVQLVRHRDTAAATMPIWHDRVAAGGLLLAGAAVVAAAAAGVVAWRERRHDA